MYACFCDETKYCLTSQSNCSNRTTDGYCQLEAIEEAKKIANKLLVL